MSKDYSNTNSQKHQANTTSACASVLTRLCYDKGVKIKRIELGYWYPLTTLHLAEMQDFFAGHTTPLHLDATTLIALRSKLGIVSSELKLGELEYLDMEARSNIRVRVYEDGLVTLCDDHTSLRHDIKELTDYFEKAYMPAIRYLFSVGAPAPKDLAGIEHETPCFIVATDCSKHQAIAILDELGATLEFELDTKDMVLYRGGEFFVIAVKPHFTGAEELIETWIFFKEFKSQLHHYMNLHRAIWTQIEAIKEERYIRGWQIKAQRTKLESYKKTIELIEARIGQMDLYMASRSKVASDRGWDTYLADILQFRYTNLEHTHDYVKSLWSMTQKYVDSAIQIMTEISAQSTKTSVQALTVISSIGVVSGIINFLALPKLPHFSRIGGEYFSILFIIALILNVAVALLYSLVRYRINTTVLVKDLHKYAHKKQ